jgi:hypothetical protein
MRTTTVYVLFAVLAWGCETTNRSISRYEYGYNPSYSGELSAVDFIKDVSDPRAGSASNDISITKGERVIVMQSGQLSPDGALVSELGDRCHIIAMSGIPSKTSVGEPKLRDAARAGGVAKIMAYWGTIETSIQSEQTKAVSWVPIVGWYIPDESQEMRISITAIVSDTATGRWTDYTVLSPETKVFHSTMTREAKDSWQVEGLKSEVYKQLVQKVVQ